MSTTNRAGIGSRKVSKIAIQLGQFKHGVGFHAVEADQHCELPRFFQIGDRLAVIPLLCSQLAEDNQQLSGVTLFLLQSGLYQCILEHSLGFLWPSQCN